jgi:hypothetical protein
MEIREPLSFFIKKEQNRRLWMSWVIPRDQVVDVSTILGLFF